MKNPILPGSQVDYWQGAVGFSPKARGNDRVVAGGWAIGASVWAKVASPKAIEADVLSS